LNKYSRGKWLAQRLALGLCWGRWTIDIVQEADYPLVTFRQYSNGTDKAAWISSKSPGLMTTVDAAVTMILPLKISSRQGNLHGLRLMIVCFSVR
jgi:hypothetical protein